MNMLECEWDAEGLCLELQRDSEDGFNGRRGTGKAEYAKCRECDWRSVLAARQHCRRQSM